MTYTLEFIWYIGSFIGILFIVFMCIYQYLINTKCNPDILILGLTVSMLWPMFLSFGLLSLSIVSIAYFFWYLFLRPFQE